MYLTIGSGDITSFLSGKNTKGFYALLQKFVADSPPHYNSFASPIDALRTGAILEQRYTMQVDDDYYSQYKAICKEYNCLISSIDFSKINLGLIIDFDELKTIHLADYLDIIIPLSELSQKEYTEVIKKKFKSNYNQLQFQLFCSGLKSANLVFLSVTSYDDELNNRRIIFKNDYLKFRIKRDETVIEQIKDRACFFQNIKDFIQEPTI